MAAAHAARINGPVAAEAREERLALLEALFTCDTLQAAAEIGVAWFVRNGVREVVVALVVHERSGVPRLVGLASRFGRGGRPTTVGVDLDDHEHALVRIMRGGAPAVLATGSLGFSATRGIAYPVPWPSRNAVDAVGVVVLGGAPKGANPRWGVRFLGRRLDDLASRVHGVAERQPAGERELLENVLGAVPDLVLVTDSEGPRFEPVRASIETPDGPAIVSVLRNVTDLQLAAQELRESYGKLRVAETAVRAERDRLDLILSSVGDPIIVTDANGGTIMTNAPAERLFTAPPGSSLEVMQRVRANDAHLSSHVASLFVLEPGGRLRGQLSLVDPRTAAAVSVEAVSGKLGSRQGEVTAIVTILHDRTEALEKSALFDELKRASNALEDEVRGATAELVRQNQLLHRQAIELEAASSAKSLFLANMSHELRTPLNAILGYTSMMLQGVSGPVPAKLMKSLSRIDSNGHHLLTIINDILDIARIEAGKMPFNPAKFVAGDLVKEVLAELEPLVVRSGLRVRTEVGKVVPIMNTDRAKVKQILVNLVSNALKFTPEGSVTVSAQWHKRTNETWISVADTGIGIADADQEAVFQDFRQVDNSPTRMYGGTGLGLAICRRLATVLGGEVRLASKIDTGSTFTLVVPARRLSKPSAPPSRKVPSR